MATPFMAEIKIMSFNFAPKGWAMCNGQLLAINQNQALFSLLGTTYGGNGQTTFALPNLQGRAAMSFGQGHILGERGGEESHTVIMSEMPAHIHVPNADVKVGDNTVFNPTNTYIANTGATQMYSTGSNNMTAMLPAMVSNIGGSQAHENRQPYLTLNFCIALQGIFPSQN
ncbi:MAG: phage Tail Collar domain protein [Candidatus Eremiobacteraeota bacterium]|jgi:microcystin-dependent protein|nr:phage Tail Collar domain protein [Candidatus Eremiobacteraeota bacterium]